MKKAMKIILSLLLAGLIIASIGWYFTVYDQTFTRDLLLAQARKNDMRGNQKLSAWFYDRAYNQSGKDPNVAIELANQYIDAGNFTKAEVTLSNAIRSGATAELYIALCNTYTQQDKLLDAVNLLASLPDSEISRQLEALRPLAPAPDHNSGFYTQYISVALNNDAGTTYFTTNGDYPSTSNTPYLEAIKLGTGETKIYAITVGENGLVSPITVLNYTIGGVIEPVVFADAHIEEIVRSQLGLDNAKVVYTNDLWQITEFNLPTSVTVLDDVQMLLYAEDLTIEGRTMQDMTFLSGLTNLRKLTLRGCRFPATAMQTLAALPKLQELTMEDCGLSSISELSGAPSLVYLNIAGNTVRNLDVLAGMPSLTRLDLQHNAVISLEAVGSLTNLEELNVSYNALTGLSPLRACGLLTVLDASHNQITSADGLESLALLEKAALDYNKITSVSELADCSRLTRLTFSNNEVTSLNGLEKLSRLDTLDFSYNKVDELPQFAAECNLQVLDGSYNSVSSLDCLKNLSNITYIFMDYNKLTDVDALADCYRLVQVNIFGNDVKDVSALTEHNIIVNYDPTKK